MKVLNYIKYTNPFYSIGFDFADRLCLFNPNNPNTKA